MVTLHHHHNNNNNMDMYHLNHRMATNPLRNNRTTMPQVMSLQFEKQQKDLEQLKLLLSIFLPEGINQAIKWNNYEKPLKHKLESLWSQ
jgi:hypothetical protein